MQDTITLPTAATDLTDVPQPASTAPFPGTGALLVSRAAAAAIALAGAGMAAAPNHPAPSARR